MNLLALIPLVLLGDGSGEWSALQTKYRCKAKETPRACAMRLRDALKTELARPTLAPSLKSGCPRRSQTGSCTPPVDGCTPLAAFIADKLSLVGPDAEIALPELELAATRMPQEQGLIRRARAAARSPDVLGAAKALFARDEPGCRTEGALLMATLRTPEASAALQDCAQSGPWEGRTEALKALARLEAAVPRALLPMLSVDQPTSVVLALIEWLAHDPSAPKDAMPWLATLATSHWSLHVREQAARVATTLGGTIVVPSPMICARADAGTAWALSPPPPRTAAEVCGPYARAQDLTFEHAVDGVCIQAGTGDLSANGAPFFRTGLASPVQLVGLGGQRYVLRSVRHLQNGAAEIDLLVHDARGWHLEFVTDLPGALRSSAVDAQGRLVLFTDEAERGAPCRNAGTVVRFTPGTPGLELLH